MSSIGIITVQLIKGYVVARIEFVAAMYLAVHTLCKRLKPLCLRQLRQFINPSIDRCCRAIYHPTLIAEDSRFHVVEIILLALLEGRVISLLLELLCLEIITRIELVADSERYDVQLFKVATHSQHLEHSILRVIA